MFLIDGISLCALLQKLYFQVLQLLLCQFPYSFARLFHSRLGFKQTLVFPGLWNWANRLATVCQNSFLLLLPQ